MILHFFSFIFIHRAFDWVATLCCEYVTFNQSISSVLQDIRMIFTYSLWQAICQRISFPTGARFEIDKVYNDRCSIILKIQIIIQTDYDLYILPDILWGSMLYILWVYYICLYVHLICCFLTSACMNIFLISTTTETYQLALWASSYESPLLHMAPAFFLVN